jgi:hypothetical protein
MRVFLTKEIAMEFDLIFSGRSSGGIDVIGRVFRTIRKSYDSQITVLVEAGEKQLAVLNKVRKDLQLMRAVSGFEPRIILYFEQDDGSYSRTTLGVGGRNAITSIG